MNELCKCLHVTKSAYYHWLHGDESPAERKNKQLAKEIEKLYAEHPDKGYRRICDELRRRGHYLVNDKRVLRLMRRLHLQSTVKGRHNCCTRRASGPEYTAENILNRDFHADAPEEKWLTDVTEFKYGQGENLHKLYLSAILDLYGHGIVAFVISDHNDNALVFKTFDRAVKLHPNAHPIFHSDRGFQYTNKSFHAKLEKQGMTQSMSRVAHCLDNGPMEGFWGILKREMYYGRTFNTRIELAKAIQEYIDYYNHQRLQRGLGVMTPYEYCQQYLAA